MNNKFDELAKELAQSATRRQALKKFGVGLAGMALACFGLTNRASAGGNSSKYLCCSYACIGPRGTLPAVECAKASHGCPDLSSQGCQFIGSTAITDCINCPSSTVYP